MTPGFLDFLRRSAHQGDQVALESSAPGSAAASWADQASASLNRAPQPAAGLRLGFIAKVFSASALGSALLISGSMWAQHTVAPALDRALRSETYASAEQTAAQARAAGFAEAQGARVVFGSDSFSQAFEDFAHQRDPMARPALGIGSHASLKSQYVSLGDQDVNLLPEQCSIRLGSNAKGALLSEAAADLRFVTLHELSHCDAMGGSWAGFSPSQLPADQARAMRLILLAESQQSDPQSPSLSSALADSARHQDPSEAQHWSGLGVELFRESVADARALLILSRVEPASWRATGWELWLQRAAGAHGATHLTPHNHATEEAVSIILSVKDEQLSRLSAKGLDELSAQAASDALVVKLAKQGWDERYDPALLPAALCAALSEAERAPASSPRWRQGELSAFGVSPEQARADRAWLQTPEGAQAVSGLLSSFKATREQGQRATGVERQAGGRPVSYAIEPSGGDLDVRYEGAWKRSPDAAWLASAALLQRAKDQGASHGFKTPNQRPWREVERLSSGAYSEVLDELRSPKLLQARAGKPTFFGHNDQTGLFVMAQSLEGLAKAEGKAPAQEQPKLNLANRRSLRAYDPHAPQAPGPKL